MFNQYVAKSGVKVFESGLRYEEDDSRLAFNDFEYAGGKSAGYIMVSPSGMKNYVKAEPVNGEVLTATFRTYAEAESFLFESL